MSLIDKTLQPGRLALRYTYQARRERVFRAWTEPVLLKQWFRVAPDYMTPIAEVDLRVGGRYRLGMQPPESSADAGQIYIASGVYRIVQPPEKLAFTWAWEGDPAPETLVTLEFHERGELTEVVLTHEQFQDEAQRDRHIQGWEGCLEQLGALLEA